MKTKIMQKGLSVSILIIVVIAVIGIAIFLLPKFQKTQQYQQPQQVGEYKFSSRVVRFGVQ